MDTPPATTPETSALNARLMQAEATIAALQQRLERTPTRAFIIGMHSVFAIVGVMLTIIIRIIFGPYAGVAPAVPAAAPQASGNTVTIGAAAEPAPDRDYVTVAEFAARNGKAPRTVLSDIAAGLLSPAPVKDGREWRIPLNSRYQPQLAADSGNPPPP